MPKISKTENLYTFDTVANSIQLSISTVTVTLGQMQKYLPATQTAPFATILTKELFL